MYRANAILLQVKKLVKPSIFAILVSLSANSVNAGQSEHSPSIFLKSCKIDIRADKVYNHSGYTDYFGNVQFLYGLANVRTDRVTLIKNKDGSCMLVANHWGAKSGNQ
jgi:hypothetical protein